MDKISRFALVFQSHKIFLMPKDVMATFWYIHIKIQGMQFYALGR